MSCFLAFPLIVCGGYGVAADVAVFFGGSRLSWDLSFLALIGSISHYIYKMSAKELSRFTDATLLKK